MKPQNKKSVEKDQEKKKNQKSVAKDQEKNWQFTTQN